MKTHFLLTTVAAFLIALIPVTASAQCDASFGDTGIVGGSFIDPGQSYFDGNPGGGFLDGGSQTANCGPNGPCGTGSRGAYVTVIAGYLDLQEQTVGGSELEYDDGFSVGGALGRRINRFLRLETEYLYRENDFEGLVDDTGAGATSFGDLMSHAVMVNGFLDLPIGSGRIVPYIGAGAGVAGIDSELAQQSDSGLNDFAVVDFDSTFAFQWMAGVSLRAIANAEFFAEYRYFEANDPSFEFSTLAGSSVEDAEYANRNVFIGLRMIF